jgi:hypothetical protein
MAMWASFAESSMHPLPRLDLLLVELGTVGAPEVIQIPVLTCCQQQFPHAAPTCPRLINRLHSPTSPATAMSMDCQPASPHDLGLLRPLSTGRWCNVARTGAIASPWQPHQGCNLEIAPGVVDSARRREGEGVIFGWFGRPTHSHRHRAELWRDVSRSNHVLPECRKWEASPPPVRE